MKPQWNVRSASRMLICLALLVCFPATADLLDIRGCTWGSQQFVMVGGNGLILTSPDAERWTVGNGNTAVRDLLSVAWGGDRFVAVGDRGSITVSHDGSEWTALPELEGVEHLAGVEWLDGLFVAVGSPGVILTSPDGLAWERRESDTIAALNDVAWDKGLYYAVGDQGALVSSNDGAHWVSREPVAEADLKAVIRISARGSYFLVVGRTPGGGLIAESEMAIHERAEVHQPNSMRWDINNYIENRPRLLANRPLNDVMRDGVRTIAVGYDIAVYLGNSWTLLGATLDEVGPLRCVASNGQRVVAAGSGGVLVSDYLNLDWREVGHVWRGGRMQALDVMQGIYQVPDTMIRTDPFDSHGRHNSPRRKVTSQLYDHWFGSAFFLYPVLQLVALLLMFRQRVWRYSALAPLIAMGVIYAFTSLALWGGSGLWPIVLMFVTPLAIGYLLILLALFLGRVAALRLRSREG